MTRDTSWRRRLEARRTDTGPAPSPSPEQIRAVVTRHGLNVDSDAVMELPRIGTVNTTLALGDRYVLRVPRPHGVADTRTESVAAAAAHRAGVTTPALIVFDDSREIFDVPYTVYERVSADNFGLHDIDPDVSGPIYREVGRQLAILHHEVRDCPDPNGYLDRPRRLEPDDLLDYMEEARYLSRYNVSWLRRVFERLRPALAGAAGYRRFLHNDVLPTNVLVRDGRFAALIDWNNSGWGDPALEFSSLPCRALPAVLDGYRDIMVPLGVETIEARILWDYLCHALEFLLAPTDLENISWGRPPFARLTEIVAMAARYRPWQRLLT